MSQVDDTLAAIGTGFGIPVSDSMVAEAHDMLEVAAKEIGEGVGDLIGEVSGAVGDISDVIGDAAQTLGEITKQINEVIGVATDIVNEVMDTLSQIWNFFKNLFSGPSTYQQLVEKLKVFAFESGMARALFLVGRGPQLPGFRITAGTTSDKAEQSKMYTAGFYDVMRNVYAVIGPPASFEPGSLAMAWADYLKYRVLSPNYAGQLFSAMVENGTANQANREYNDVLHKIARWKEVAGVVWDKIIIERQQAENAGDGITFSDSVLLTAAPGAYAVKAIFK